MSDDSEEEEIFTMTSIDSDSKYLTWGCEDMGLDLLADWLSVNAKKKSVVVAVIDSGVKPNDEISDRVLPGSHVVTGGDGTTDYLGHGTHVAGTILDCTQGLDVKVLPVGVFGEEKYTSASSICMGLEYAMSQSPDIINMSLGGGRTEESKWQEKLIHDAISDGMVVVAAAGNGDANRNPVDTAGQSPAAIEECIVVGAIDASHNIGSFSNYGKSVDVCAPGVGIVSYSIKPGSVSTRRGTSQAAPHIAALAAMLRMYVPDATPAQIEKYIKDYCQPLGDELYYGKGLPQASYYIED